MKNLNMRTKSLFLVVVSLLILTSLASACAALAPSMSKPAYPSSGGAATTPSTSPRYQTPSTTPAPAPYPSSSGAGKYTQPGESRNDSIGLAAGGAKDIGNFRENIKNNYLPLPTDLTYEGLFYDYYFDTGASRPTDKLFSPSYSYAVTKDPFSHKTDYYLSVGLNSGMKESDFARKDLNLVIVLDISGSMSSPFNSYYYDQTGKQMRLSDRESRMTKLEVAKEAVVSILDQLTDRDRFAIVLFDDRASVLQRMTGDRRTNMEDIRNKVLSVKEGGSTDLSAGMRLATDILGEYSDPDPYRYENRIIFLTDAMPNTGETGEYSLMRLLKKNADNRVYTTFFGIGVDFNTDLVDYITKIRGANYYSVHSPGEFSERVNDEFDYMVTPLVFNLKLTLDSAGWDIEKVYGSPEADLASGDLMKVNTLFPSKREDGQTKGGLILLKLKKNGSGAGRVTLRATYEDRSGRKDGSEAVVSFETARPEYFDNDGIRKGVLLARYADLMKNWTIDQREHVRVQSDWLPRINSEYGIIVPPSGLGKWERQSLPLTVSSQYRGLFREFAGYFASEADQIGDSDLDRELDILDRLGQFRY